MTEKSVEPPSERDFSNDQLNNRIYFRLFVLGNLLQRQAVAQLGVTTVQWATLGALSQEKYAAGIPFGTLAEYLVVSRQNMDGVIKRLERDGLVERVTGAGDRRARMVRLTKKGREFWKTLAKQIYRFYDQAAADFKFNERVALVHYLNILQKDLLSVDLTKAPASSGKRKVA